MNMTLMKSFSILTIAAFVSGGCMGRTPDPIARQQVGDHQRTCKGIQMEYDENHAKIAELESKVAQKVGYNVVMGAAGVFLIAPWFFMDLKGAEETEIEALKRRRGWLRELAASKNCQLVEPKKEEKKAEEKKQAEVSQ